MCLVLGHFAGCCCDDPYQSLCQDCMPVERACYGYHSTCWRAWPAECPNCPPEHTMVPTSSQTSEPHPATSPEVPSESLPPVLKPPQPDPEKSESKPSVEPPANPESNPEKPAKLQSRKSGPPLAPVVLSTSLEYPMRELSPDANSNLPSPQNASGQNVPRPVRQAYKTWVPEHLAPLSVE